MNPDRSNKTFLTSSHDATVLVWDLRSDAAVVCPPLPPPLFVYRRAQGKADGGSFLMMQGRLNHMEGPSIVEWDSTGQIWAVALPETSYIMLYSSASFDVVSFTRMSHDNEAFCSRTLR